MNGFIRLNDIVSYFPACNEPLSADVGMIQGSTLTWFFDVGNCNAVLEAVNSTEGGKGVIISHFHPDHMGNLGGVDFRECYVSSNTFKYCRCGTVVGNDLYIEDGASLHIFPLPSSHAKGCLGLEVNGTWAFTGDAVYATRKEGRIVYNAQLLLEEIRVLFKAEWIIQSHNMGEPKPKAEVLKELREIYSLRVKDEAYIKL